MAEYIVTFNIGSSSLKSGVFDVTQDAQPLFALTVDLHSGHCKATGSAPAELLKFPPNQFAEAVAEAILASVQNLGGHIKACIHRVVHGGPKRHRPEQIDSALLLELERYEPLCPLHQPVALEVIRHVQALFPCLPQAAAFDTAFHQGQPRLATEYALPLTVRQDGVRGYGFHGISCQHVLREIRTQMPTLASGRVIIAHLGSGASITAVKNGRSAATTMGFSTLDGLPMATRPGHLDAGILLYLLENGWAKSRLTNLLYHQSGMLGLSGISADMRVLVQSQQENARFAVDYFCYRAAREVASLACAVGGMDGLVFTGGIGEHIPEVRQKIAGHLEWLGIQLNPDANLRNEPIISSESSLASLLVIPANEEREMYLLASQIINTSNLATVSLQ